MEVLNKSAIQQKKIIIGQPDTPFFIFKENICKSGIRLAEIEKTIKYLIKMWSARCLYFLSCYSPTNQTTRLSHARHTTIGAQI